MTWIAAGAAVVGAGASLYGSSKANKGQQSAADAATQEQQRQYDTTRSDNMPALQARNDAIGGMQSLATQYGNNVPSASDVMNTPGYQFGLSQGTNALQSGAAAAGGLYSGAAMKALNQYGNDYGTTKYDDSFNRMQTSNTNAFNRQASIAGQGQMAAMTIADAGQNAANMSGNIGMSNANAQGAADIAQGNIWGKAAGQIGNAFHPYMQPQGMNSGGGFTPAANSGFQGDPDFYNSADGGSVMLDQNGVPIVGSRSPVRSGGGGGLSKNALAQILAQPQPVPPPAGQSLPNQPLPANPLMNPQAIRAARMQAAGEWANGGPIIGPGGPKSDSIPARLSNGEHVMDTASVTALGGGSNVAGQMKLNKLRAMLHGGNHA